jgi:putative aminopeptidase FrvX
MLQAAGADSIWIDKAGNVIALRKGRTGKKTIVIEGHLLTSSLGHPKLQIK